MCEDCEIVAQTKVDFTHTVVLTTDEREEVMFGSITNKPVLLTFHFEKIFKIDVSFEIYAHKLCWCKTLMYYLILHFVVSPSYAYRVFISLRLSVFYLCVF